MADPYAPPMDSPPPRPATATRPEGGLVEEYAAPPAVNEPLRRRERPWREARFEREQDRDRDHDRDRPRAEPARPGMFWVIAAIGIGLLCLARLVLFFAMADELDGDISAAALIATVGVVTLSVGLALAAVLQRGLATPWRIALLLGAGFFAVVGWDGLGFVALL